MRPLVLTAAAVLTGCAVKVAPTAAPAEAVPATVASPPTGCPDVVVITTQGRELQGTTVLWDDDVVILRLCDGTKVSLDVSEVARSYRP